MRAWEAMRSCSSADSRRAAAASRSCASASARRPAFFWCKAAMCSWQAGGRPGDPFTATGDLIAYRGLFLIDLKGVVRHQLINDLPLGRSIDEAIRMVDSLQFFEQHGEVCPANWTRGKKGMKPTNQGVADYLAMAS